MTRGDPYKSVNDNFIFIITDFPCILLIFFCFLDLYIFITFALSAPSSVPRAFCRQSLGHCAFLFFCAVLLFHSLGLFFFFVRERNLRSGAKFSVVQNFVCFLVFPCYMLLGLLGIILLNLRNSSSSCTLILSTLILSTLTLTHFLVFYLSSLVLFFIHGRPFRQIFMFYPGHVSLY